MTPQAGSLRSARRHVQLALLATADCACDEAGDKYKAAAILIREGLLMASHLAVMAYGQEKAPEVISEQVNAALALARKTGAQGCDNYC